MERERIYYKKRNVQIFSSVRESVKGQNVENITNNYTTLSECNEGRIAKVVCNTHLKVFLLFSCFCFLGTNSVCEWVCKGSQVDDDEIVGVIYVS